MEYYCGAQDLKKGNKMREVIAFLSFGLIFVSSVVYGTEKNINKVKCEKEDVVLEIDRANKNVNLSMGNKDKLVKSFTILSDNTTNSLGAMKLGDSRNQNEGGSLVISLAADGALMAELTMSDAIIVGLRCKILAGNCTL